MKLCSTFIFYENLFGQCDAYNVFLRISPINVNANDATRKLYYFISRIHIVGGLQRGRSSSKRGAITAGT